MSPCGFESHKCRWRSNLVAARPGDVSRSHTHACAHVNDTSTVATQSAVWHMHHTSIFSARPRHGWTSYVLRAWLSVIKCRNVFRSAFELCARLAGITDTLAEWLRRRPAKPMGSPRAGSNPTGVAGVAAPAPRVTADHRETHKWPLVVESRKPQAWMSTELTNRGPLPL